MSKIAREKIFKVRFNSIEWAKLEAEAESRQVSMAELARMWVQSLPNKPEKK